MTILLVDDVVDLFTFTSSVLNPLIFGYHNKSFREELKRCCCSTTCSKCFVKCKTKAEGLKAKEKATVTNFQNQTTVTLSDRAIEDLRKNASNVCFPADQTKLYEEIALTTKL